MLSLCKLSSPILQLILSGLMKWQDTSLKTCFGSDLEPAKCPGEEGGGSCDCRQTWEGSRMESSGCKTNFHAQLLLSGFCNAYNTGHKGFLIELRLKILFFFSVFLYKVFLACKSSLIDTALSQEPLCKIFASVDPCQNPKIKMQLF